MQPKQSSLHEGEVGNGHSHLRKKTFLAAKQRYSKAHLASCRKRRFFGFFFKTESTLLVRRRSFLKYFGSQWGLGSMSKPVAQNLPSFQPTELYAHSGRGWAFDFN